MWLAEALSTWSNPLLTDEFPTRVLAGVDTRISFNYFNSEALSGYSNFPPGFRMKTSTYVKRQSLEVREFSVISFILIAFCQPYIA